ncbi:glutathione S-transferase C-terminal domain-containing protein, partial [Rhizobium ruizarguesonis]
RTEIDAFHDRIYPDLTNGVYRAGFATTQIASEEAFADVFSCLDWVEQPFEGRSFLFADYPTEGDIRLFVTPVRFDVAYQGIFKC